MGRAPRPAPDRAIPWILDKRGPGTDVMTGASGFVGVHLTRRPLEDGWTVRTSDLRPTIGMDPPDVRHAVGDEHDLDAVGPCLAGAEGQLRFRTSRRSPGWPAPQAHPTRSLIGFDLSPYGRGMRLLAHQRPTVRRC